MLLPLSFVSPGFVSDGFIVMSTILPCLDSFPPWRRSVGKRGNTHTSHHWKIQIHHTEKYTFTTGWNTNTPHGEIQIHHTEKYFSYHNFLDLPRYRLVLSVKWKWYFKICVPYRHYIPHYNGKIMEEEKTTSKAMRRSQLHDCTNAIWIFFKRMSWKNIFSWKGLLEGYWI